MTLVVDGVVADRPVSVRADPGQWVVVPHPAPEAVVAALAGLDSDDLPVSLDGQDLSGLPAIGRHRAQLCAASCRLDQLPALRVADVIGLGLRAPQPALWQALVGTSKARGHSADDEAQVRALAGRLGLAGWVDRSAVNLPLKVEALVDIARALAGAPKAFVWRRPEWLDPASRAEINDAVAAEQQLAGFAVVEFIRARRSSLAEQ